MKTNDTGKGTQNSGFMLVIVTFLAVGVGVNAAEMHYNYKYPVSEQKADAKRNLDRLLKEFNEQKNTKNG